VRVVYLRPRFHRMRAVYAPPGSPQNDDVYRVLAELEDEQHTLPAPQDEEALRTPHETIWARRVPGTDLVLTYSILPMMIEVHTVRPDWERANLTRP
jgi:hypothetical protein